MYQKIAKFYLTLLPLKHHQSAAVVVEAPFEVPDVVAGIAELVVVLNLLRVRGIRAGAASRLEKRLPCVPNTRS